MTCLTKPQEHALQVLNILGEKGSDHELIDPRVVRNLVKKGLAKDQPLWRTWITNAGVKHAEASSFRLSPETAAIIHDLRYSKRF